MSKRNQFYKYYSTPKEERFDLLEKSAAVNASTNREFDFKGDAIEYSVVVRADLNGYSKWAKDKTIADRVELLDDFFSHAAKYMSIFNGVYFRDEGDCLVVLFSDYFQNRADKADILMFCKSMVNAVYGKDKLTAKCCVAGGEIAYYQKSHEKQSDDWSAEGQAFVNAHRLESSVESKPRIYIYDEEQIDMVFKNVVAPEIRWAPAGTKAAWTVYQDEKYQVEGLGLKGGWANISYFENNNLVH